MIETQPILFVAINKGHHRPAGQFYARNIFHAKTVARAIFPRCYVKAKHDHTDRPICDLCECRPCICNKRRPNA
jgi:hypothetical protein